MSHKNQYQSIQGSVQHSIMLNPALKNVTLNLFSGSFQGLPIPSAVILNLVQNLIHRAKPLMIHFTLIVGLCFGQVEESTRGVTLSMPLSKYLGQPVQDNKPSIQQIVLASHLSSNYLNPNALMLQIKNDTLQPKTSRWKQTGIYGLEFLGGAGIGTAISVYLAYIAEGGGDFDHPTYAILGYSVGHILFTSSCTCIIGKLLGQKGSWRKSTLGTATGCLIGIPVALLLNKMYPEGFMNGVALGIFLVTPPSGAVIGFNLK